MSGIKERIEGVGPARFHSVLFNDYRSGRDGVAWHADDEREPGSNPILGSVRFGAARHFLFRHRLDPTLRRQVELTHGSCLGMDGATQHPWFHQVLKESRPHGPRIHLTFRTIRSANRRS